MWFAKAGSKAFKQVSMEFARAALQIVKGNKKRKEKDKDKQIVKVIGLLYYVD